MPGQGTQRQRSHFGGLLFQRLYWRRGKARNSQLIHN
jgi:hypothetical protein